MAQDLLELKPEAIIHTNTGMMAVDYSQLDVEFRRVKLMAVNRKIITTSLTASWTNSR